MFLQVTLPCWLKSFSNSVLDLGAPTWVTSGRWTTAGSCQPWGLRPRSGVGSANISETKDKMPSLYFPKQRTAKPGQTSHLRGSFSANAKQDSVYQEAGESSECRCGWPVIGPAKTWVACFRSQSGGEKAAALGPAGRYFIAKIIDRKTFLPALSTIPLRSRSVALLPRQTS